MAKHPADPAAYAADPEPDLSRVDPDRLSRLWSHVLPAAGTGPAVRGDGATHARAVTWESVDLAELLRLQLAAPLDVPGVTAAGPAGAGPDPFTYGGLLLGHPAPPADLLRAVKDWAKPQMGGHADDGVGLPREVAGVIYFAAVAAGRLRGAGDGPVSTLADGQVRKGAAWALRLPWLDAGTAALFRQAVAALATQPDGSSPEGRAAGSSAPRG